MAKKYRWEDFVLDLDAFRLERGGVPLALEPKAFNLLVLLAERPGHLFTKQEIFERLWPGTAVTDHALTRVVAQLRRVLGDEARDGRYIETVPTRGYRWLPRVEEVQESPRDPAATSDDVPAPAVVERRSFPAIASVILVIAIALIGIVAWAQRNTISETSDRPRASGHDVTWPVQVTTYAGLDLHPAFAPQGDAIVFASDRSGSFELYVRALEGAATEVALTSDGQDSVQPAWSPDGGSIAFHSHRRGGIWVMPARGGVSRQLVTEGSHPAWSSDGRRIAFQSDEPADATPSAFGAQSGATIEVVDADGRNQRPLTMPGLPVGGHASPAWTRDGRFVVFSVFDGGRNNGVWSINVETHAINQLLGDTRALYELVFDPDDSSIYVAGGDPFITRIPFDRREGKAAGERELITVPGVAGVRGLSMSPDGRRLAFSGLTMASQLWVQPLAADGSGSGDARALTTDTSRRNSLPVISPDGTCVAYVSTRGGEPPNVWTIGVDGKNAIQVTDNDSPDVRPAWLPDGHRVAFLSPRQDRLGLWAVDLTTRREEMVLSLSDVARSMRDAGGGMIGEVSLSGSTKLLAMSIITSSGANRRLFISPTRMPDVRTMSAASQWIGYPSWSRDERHLAVEIKEGSSTHAGVVDVDSGALRRLTNERGQTWIRSWSPDGTKIAAAVFRDGRWSLRWIDAGSGATGAMTPPSGPNTYVRYPEWSPRGDAVVYERGELRGNVWTLALPAR